MKISKLEVEHCSAHCVTDFTPRITFALSSSRQGATLKNAKISLNGWSQNTKEQVLIPYGGAPLKPFTEYTVTVEAEDDAGEKDKASTTFCTGRLNTPWFAEWITDGEYKFTQKRVSPVPMVFRKTFRAQKQIKKATAYCTAMGIYSLNVNGKKAGERYFAPGFTSYKTTLQYQTYDITSLLREENEILVTVAGGWAVGSFVFTRKNRITANRQALLAELHIEYDDGTREVIGTDGSWQVTQDGNVRMADLYDGETYDATVDLSAAAWRNAKKEKLRVSPKIVAEFGASVVRIQTLAPVSVKKHESGALIYDFGENFAGVICAKLRAHAGQKIVFRHAEILKEDGSLYTELLRSAKATATYIAKEGEQEYSPEFTYMGFRYVSAEGIGEEDLSLTAYVLSSDLAPNGSFTCSNELINQFQQNILRSARSNFMDIPTDCPQRDERMGWTGDIAVFASTACYNFNMARFLEKWLNDVKAEQRKTGGIPNTVPAQGYGFPATMPVMAIDFWGDACLNVPWAEYLARGDKELLETYYPVMKKYVDACIFWAKFCSVGKRKYIWHTLFTFHFGDWIAPDVAKMSDWQKRSKYTATASLRHTSLLLSKIAALLHKDKDAAFYQRYSKKVAKAYLDVFTDGNGKMKNEFQTGYVLPLAFHMFPEEQCEAAAQNLAALVEKNNYCIGTGFPGTPYILFALADNGQRVAAFEMLTNTKCPSWLYEVVAGGTTVWERWDALKEDGTGNLGAEDGTGGMVSFNHYASGAVGDFLYRRVAGIEPITGGYRTFRVKPTVGGGLTFAKGEVECPYGVIKSEWHVEGSKFTLCVHVPVSTACRLILPWGEEQELASGNYTFEGEI